MGEANKWQRPINHPRHPPLAHLPGRRARGPPGCPIFSCWRYQGAHRKMGWHWPSPASHMTSPAPSQQPPLLFALPDDLRNFRLNATADGIFGELAGLHRSSVGHLYCHKAW